LSGRAWIRALVLAAFAATAGFFTYQWQQARNAPVADLAFTDLDGKPYKLSGFRGKLTLINFWASWCGPCMHELPILVKAQAAFGDRGLQIIGPALDAPAAVRETMKKFGVNYPVFVGDAEVTAAMDALGDEMGVLPYSVLIAPDGKVLERLAGGLSEPKLTGWLEKHLAR
jgi:thiol-disulfide isomerase/thioredoxin